MSAFNHNKKQSKECVVRSTQRSSRAGRQNASNLISNKSGKHPSNRNSLGAWRFFFTAEIMYTIVVSTNVHSIKIGKNFNAQKPGWNASSSKLTNATDIEIFLKLWYMRRLIKLTFHRVHHLFSHLYGNAVFSTTMSLNEFLSAHLRFDNEATREERCKQDRFADIRDTFQIFTGNGERVLVLEGFYHLMGYCIQYVWGWYFDSTIKTNFQNMEYFFDNAK